MSKVKVIIGDEAVDVDITDVSIEMITGEFTKNLFENLAKVTVNLSGYYNASSDLDHIYNGYRPVPVYDELDEQINQIKDRDLSEDRVSYRDLLTGSNAG